MKPTKINQIDIGIACPTKKKNVGRDVNFVQGQKPIHSRILPENTRKNYVKDCGQIVYDYPWLDLRGNASFFAEGWTVRYLESYARGRKCGDFVMRTEVVDGKSGVRVWKKQ